MTYKRNIKLVGSLIDYVKYIKPYHTKLKEFSSELTFRDTLNTLVIESFEPEVHFNQLWGINELPGLGYISEGRESDGVVVLPDAIFSRFSLNTYLNYGQQPPGDDPATNNLEDLDLNGIPDIEEPWTGDPSQSHQLGSDIIPVPLAVTGITYGSATVVTSTSTEITGTVPLTITLDVTPLTTYGIPSTVQVVIGENTYSATISGTTVSLTPTFAAPTDTAFVDPDVGATTDAMKLKAFATAQPVQVMVTTATGRYATPFHHGASVRVDGTLQELGTHYTVDKSRGFIQFLDGYHPASSSNIDINWMVSDRFFISVTTGFDVGISRAYDVPNYDDMPFDTEADSFFDEGGYDDAMYDDAVEILLSDYFVVEVDTMLAARATTTFYNSRPGSVKPGLEGLLIYPSQITGTIWTITAVLPFKVKVQQTFPFEGPVEYAYLNKPFDNGLIAFTIRNPWYPYYFVQDADSYRFYTLTPDIIYDEADFWPSTQLKTKHGVVDDPQPSLHAPVRVEFLGKLSVLPSGQHAFIFDEVPASGTYVEVRVEQTKQFNPRVNTTMTEELTIMELINPSDASGLALRTHAKVIS